MRSILLAFVAFVLFASPTFAQHGGLHRHGYYQSRNQFNHFDAYRSYDYEPWNSTFYRTSVAPYYGPGYGYYGYPVYAAPVVPVYYDAYWWASW